MKTRDERTLEALVLFDAVRTSIALAYVAEAAADPDYALVQTNIRLARETMLAFEAKAEALAKDGLGVPLLDTNRSLLRSLE